MIRKNRTLERGLLVVFEGIDGSGKSTQIALLKEKLESRGIKVRCFNEPTRGRWGRKIREAALRADSLTPEEELDLFLKDRREDVRKNLKPALTEKAVVLLDRYYFSTMAYQGAKGIDPERIRMLNEAFAVKPDLVFILDVSAGRGLKRIEGRAVREELFEREDYLIKVRRIFKSLKGHSLVHLAASLPAGDIGRKIFRRVSALIRENSSGFREGQAGG